MERGGNVSNAQYKYRIYCSTRGCTAFVLYLREQTIMIQHTFLNCTVWNFQHVLYTSPCTPWLQYNTLLLYTLVHRTVITATYYTLRVGTYTMHITMPHNRVPYVGLQGVCCIANKKYSLILYCNLVLFFFLLN